MKTIREWANLCADDTIRKWWLDNANNCVWNNWFFDIDEKTMAEALIDSFDWEDSPEGADFWDKIYNDMRNNPEKYLKKNKRIMFHDYEE